VVRLTLLMLVPVAKGLSLGGTATLSSRLDLTGHFPSQDYGPVAEPSSPVVGPR
jgi:hypothetical protein